MWDSSEGTWTHRGPPIINQGDMLFNQRSYAETIKGNSGRVDYIEVQVEKKNARTW